jgi:hypothetical protein
MSTSVNQECDQTVLTRPWQRHRVWSWIWAWRDRRTWFWGEIAYGRLFREYENSCAELSGLVKRTNQSQNTWFETASTHLENVRLSLQCRDIEGGWSELNAAHRASVMGLNTSEIQNRAVILREECQKLAGWRAIAAGKLLGTTGADVTADKIILAMELRDEDAANKYHKIWLQGEQLGVLVALVAFTLLLFLVAVPAVLLMYFGASPKTQSYVTVSQVSLFGILGAAFSAAQSLISFPSSTRVPERVANLFVTVSRTIFGGILAVAGYEFLRSRILQIIDVGTGSGGENVSLALAVAFIFGYAGERVVARVAGSIAKNESTDSSSSARSK